MSGSDKKIQPIIVKKIKKGGHGHHGGAWKIAYADFVTAMMAFFLLMWLLGSTTKGELKGISDVFNTPLKVAFAGGSGSGDSTSIINGGGQDLTRSVGQVKRGDIDPKKRTKNPHALANDQKRKEGQRLKGLAVQMQSVISNDSNLSKLKNQIRMDMIAEGLRIQIVDDQKRPMFDSASAEVQQYMRDLLRSIGKLLNGVENSVSLTGHTDATSFSGGQRAYSNWELSTERANASRRELIAGGMSENKVLRVVGMAAAVPFDRENRNSPVNRRISIVVLTDEAADLLLSEPEIANEEDFEQDEFADEDLNYADQRNDNNDQGIDDRSQGGYEQGLDRRDEYESDGGNARDRIDEREDRGPDDRLERGADRGGDERFEQGENRDPDDRFDGSREPDDH